jgi:hypothetical protein
MIRQLWIIVGVVTTLLTCAAVPALAALPNPLADGLRKCASETDQTRRLACFDALAATVPKVEADQFGLTAEIAQKREPPPAAGEKAAPKPAEPTLSGTITAIRESGNGELVFTLDNQQVWVQAQVDTRFRFAVGDTVHIEHGSMSSLWLAADKGRKTKVKRIS